MKVSLQQFSHSWGSSIEMPFLRTAPTQWQDCSLEVKTNIMSITQQKTSIKRLQMQSNRADNWFKAGDTVQDARDWEITWLLSRLKYYQFKVKRNTWFMYFWNKKKNYFIFNYIYFFIFQLLIVKCKCKMLLAEIIVVVYITNSYQTRNRDLFSLLCNACSKCWHFCKNRSQ